MVREINASLPVYNVRTMAEHVERNLFLRKIPARMFVVIAPLLLALVAIGIYAVVSYSVSQRTTEIGVRIALGATSDRVVGQIVKEGLLVLSSGLLLASLIAGMVKMHLFSGGPGAWTILMVVPVVLLMVAAYRAGCQHEGPRWSIQSSPYETNDLEIWESWNVDSEFPD